MATYKVTLSTALNRAYLKDQNIYGASRIGMSQKCIALYDNATVPYTIPDVQQNTLGNIAYEITNYLGNVNVVISDRKTYVSTTAAFKAVVLSKTDYTACTRISWLNKEYGIMPTLISLNKEDIINRRHYFPFGMLNDTWFSGLNVIKGYIPNGDFFDGEVRSIYAVLF